MVESPVPAGPADAAAGDVHARLARGEASGHEERLEILVEIHRALEGELDDQTPAP